MNAPLNRTARGRHRPPARATVVVGAVGGQALGTLTSGVISLPFSLLTLGVLAEAFDQLRDTGPNTEAL